jgi:phosphatidylserine/phosphatidylglycerophosphate/cardiolipin synthase-like enzyme
MKRSALSVILILGVLASGVAADEEIQASYSPKAGCARLLDRELSKARQSILIQVPSPVPRLVSDALSKARRRGVKVEIMMNQSQQRVQRGSRDLKALASARIPADNLPSVLIDKTVVVDDTTVIMGSFDYSKAAHELNRDDLVVVRDKDLAAAFIKFWQEHEAHPEGDHSGKE